MLLVDSGHRVAVLSVDPSSTRTYGSILGDKTRMVELSRSDRAYVRPSPSGGTLGGVARATYEAVSLCEAAGYNIVLIETVGVGQSEVAVSDLVDMVLLLVSPAGGDELQGMKKGIVEVADLVIVNKADGALKGVARDTKVDYMHALQLLPHKHSFWLPQALMISSVENQKETMQKLWEIIEKFRQAATENNDLVKIRASQRKRWMWTILRDELMLRIQRSDSSETQKLLHQLEDELEKGITSPRVAAAILIEQFHSKSKS